MDAVPVLDGVCLESSTLGTETKGQTEGTKAEQALKPQPTTVNVLYATELQRHRRAGKPQNLCVSCPNLARHTSVNSSPDGSFIQESWLVA